MRWLSHSCHPTDRRPDWPHYGRHRPVPAGGMAADRTAPASTGGMAMQSGVAHGADVLRRTGQHALARLCRPGHVHEHFFRKAILMVKLPRRTCMNRAIGSLAALTGAGQGRSMQRNWQSALQETLAAFAAICNLMRDCRTLRVPAVVAALAGFSPGFRRGAKPQGGLVLVFAKRSRSLTKTARAARPR